MLKRKSRKVIDLDKHYSSPYQSSSVIRANYAVKDQLLEYYFEDGKTLYELFMRGVKISGDKPCCGWRLGPELPYTWNTYNQVLERAKQVGSGLIDLGARPKEFIGVIAGNRIETAIVEQACNCYSMVYLPIPDSNIETIKTVIQVTEVKVIVLEQIFNARQIVTNIMNMEFSLKIIVVMETPDEEIIRLGNDYQVKIVQFSTLESSGKMSIQELIPPKPDDLYTITWSSGTTGDSKGIMLKHKNLVAAISGCYAFFKGARIKFDAHQVYLSFFPCSHVIEVFMKSLMYGVGGRVGFFAGDRTKLLNDARRLKPTFFVSPVQLVTHLYKSVMTDLQKSWFKLKLFNAAINAKSKLFKKKILTSNTIWDYLVFRKIRKLFGGKVEVLITGGAPINDQCLNFIQCSLGVNILYSYGLTETSNVHCISYPFDFQPGSVGPPLICSLIKLIDAPQQSYFVENGFGEICVKGANVFSGYYKDEVLTNKVIDKDGWFHTGDVGTWLNNGSLKIIDRRKNILILSNGEQVIPEKVESAFVQIPIIHQIFVYGDQNHDFVVAIVVPNQDMFKDWCKQKSIFGSYSTLCENPKVIEFMFCEIQNFGIKNNFKLYEIPKKITLSEDYFTQENGLLTPTRKPKRNEIYITFQTDIEDMFI